MAKNKNTGKKKSSGRRLRTPILLALILTNIVLMILLSSKLITMKSRINELNSIISASAAAAYSETLNLSEKENSGEIDVTDDTYYDNTVSGNSADTGTVQALNRILSTENIAEDSYAAKVGLSYVAAPVKRSESTVKSILQELSKDNEDILEICSNFDKYPSRLLENLSNNPEMASFVKNYTGTTKKASSGFTESELNEQYPLLLQWDERWGYVSYGSESTIAVSGCGPTCLSMVLFSLTRDESLTPDVLADYAMNNGYYMYGTGTMWALFEDVPEIYGVKSEKIDTKDKSVIMQALDEGKVLVFSVGPGEFTAYGHFIFIYGVDEDGLLMINDPNCVYRSTVHWDYSKIKDQIKGIWSFEYNNFEID
jgi:hypothetical protein